MNARHFIFMIRTWPFRLENRKQIGLARWTRRTAALNILTDLSPFDYFLWSSMKSICIVTILYKVHTVNSEMDLETRISIVSTTIRERPSISKYVHKSIYVLRASIPMDAVSTTFFDTSKSFILLFFLLIRQFVLVSVFWPYCVFLSVYREEVIFHSNPSYVHVF